jgi:hypothetical protein
LECHCSGSFLSTKIESQKVHVTGLRAGQTKHGLNVALQSRHTGHSQFGYKPLTPTRNMYTRRMPKRLKRHLINFLRLTGVYVAITSGLGAAQILTSVLTEVNEFATIEWVVSIIYFFISVWFIWRFYTGMIRDGDFWDD